MRDVDTTFSNKQVLAVPPSADLADTAATSVVTPRSHSPAGGWNLRGIIKNTGANAFTTGSFIATAQFSTDGGTSFRTLGPREVDILGTQLDVGKQQAFNVPLGRGFFYELGITPANMRVRLRYRTSGHTTAGAVTLEATAYLDDGGPGAFN